MAGQEVLSTFVSFPDKEEMVSELRSIDGAKPEHEPLFRLIAERLALKAYDRSAFVFILIELVYEFQEIYSGSLSELLSQSVLVLSGDPELTESALQAYEEIKATLEPKPKPDPEPDDAFLEAFPATRPDPLGPYVSRGKCPDQERLMVELQEAQKQLADFGLSARMSIDMTLSRSEQGSVSHALREIGALQVALRHFEVLLAEAQDRILEEIGVLEKD